MLRGILSTERMRLVSSSAPSHNDTDREMSPWMHLVYQSCHRKNVLNDAKQESASFIIPVMPKSASHVRSYHQRRLKCCGRMIASGKRNIISPWRNVLTKNVRASMPERNSRDNETEHVARMLMQKREHATRHAILSAFVHFNVFESRPMRSVLLNSIAQDVPRILHTCAGWNMHGARLILSVRGNIHGHGVRGILSQDVSTITPMLKPIQTRFGKKVLAVVPVNATHRSTTLLRSNGVRCVRRLGICALIVGKNFPSKTLPKTTLRLYPRVARIPSRTLFRHAAPVIAGSIQRMSLHQCSRFFCWMKEQRINAVEWSV